MERETNQIGKIHVRTDVEGTDSAWATELPLRLLVLGDFTPESPHATDWTGPSRLIQVDKNNFQTVMQQLNPRLSLDVPNRLSDSPQTLSVELSFSDIRAFRPEDIAQQVDALSSLLEIRRLASQVKEGELTFQAFMERLQQTSVAPVWIERLHQLLTSARGAEEALPEQPVIPHIQQQSSPLNRLSASKDSALDSLLDMVDIGTLLPHRPTPEQGKPPAQPSPVDDLVRAIAKPKGSLSRTDRSIAETFIEQIDETLNKQINDILHHEKFQQLESTWRGLKFFIDRTDFRRNVRIELLSVPKNELPDAIYHQVLMPEYHDLTDAPLSAMIADDEFDRTPEDMELLENIAKMAASIQLPFIASVGPAFFGLQTVEELNKLPGLRSYFQRPEYAQWNALRDSEAAQYLVLTLPRFLLRYPYGPDGDPVKAFHFIEHPTTAKNYLWGRGAFAVAILLVRRFIETGWCTQITGLRGGIVESLPIWVSRLAGREVHIPLDVWFPESKELEFVEAGFILLSSRMNDDKAYVRAAPTVYRPKKYDTPEETQEAQFYATLPYQLFVTRMAHSLRRMVRDVSTGLPPEQVQTQLEAKFRAILTPSGSQLEENAVTVEVTESEEKPDHYYWFRLDFSHCERGRGE